MKNNKFIKDFFYSDDKKYDSKSTIEEYVEYLEKHLNKNIEYSEYLAESIDSTINYTEYLAQNLNRV
jgi:hypothetical protein